MNRKSQNAQNIKQVLTVGNGLERTIYKKASRKDKARQRARQAKEQQEIWNNKYDENDKATYKFGIFNKKGYVMVKGFATREEAEEYLSTSSFYKDVKFRYEIRELIW